MNKTLNIFLLSVMLYACQGSEKREQEYSSPSLIWPSDDATSSEYLNWIQEAENGFKKTKTIGEFKFTATYIPHIAKAIRELGEKSNDLQLRSQVAEEYSDLENYELEITIPMYNDELIRYNVNGEEEYSKRVNHYSFSANQQCSLVLNGDTLPCPVHVWERTFQAVNQIKLQLAFPASNIKSPDCKRELIFDDIIFNNGPIHFLF